MEWNVSVPDGVSPCGRVKIETFTISQEEASFANIRSRSRADRVYAGTFKRLIIDNEVVMSNTHMEIITNRIFILRAEGKILINGLGLGMVIDQLLEKHKQEQCIEHITVIERDPRVIALVGPHYASNPLITIIEADALEYKPPKGLRYNAVWHDIWTFITPDNIEDMKILHRRYGKRTDWQGSWARDMCEDRLRQEKSGMLY